MSCNIEITSGEPVLMGTSIEGNIRCTFSKPTSLKDILLHFFGEESTGTFSTGKLHTHGNYVLIDVEKSILDSETSIPTGDSSFPFSIEVPLRLPATFSTVNGCVHYYLKATVKRPAKKDIFVKQTIQVTRPIDLNNYIPALQISFETSTDRVISYCGWSRGKIILNAEVRKRLFLIGEKIIVNIDIINSSTVGVKNLFGRIIRTITIHFTDPRPYEMTHWEFVTKSCKFPGVAKHEEVAYPFYIEIPPNLYVPNIKYSRLFKTSYELQIIAKLSGFNTAMVLQFEIYIGHIPAGNDSTQQKSILGRMIK